MTNASGIYVITCVTNGKIYIGRASNIKKRWLSHRSRLRGNKHKNAHLQSAWNKYGEHNFTFDILEHCPCENLVQREQYYLDTFKPFSPVGFNVSISSANATFGRPMSLETRAKIGNANKGRILSPERREQMRKQKTGTHLSAEARAKIGVASKNRIRSPETYAKVSAKLSGRKPSQKSIDASIAAFSKTYIATDPDGTQYRVTSLREFCQAHNLTRSRMASVAIGRHSHHKGWKCEYAPDST